MNSITNFLVFNSATTFQTYELLLPIALILLFGKVFAIFSKKIKLPQIVGFLIAGLLLGLIKFIPNQNIFNNFTENGINLFAKIGVVLIMFSAGLETDFKKIKQVGFKVIFITLLGIIIPILGGFILSSIFFKENLILSSIFYGVILSATSVSVTVACLKELKKLDTDLGLTVVSAAILDDVIGIILLSLVTSLNGSNDGPKYVENVNLNIFIMILIMISFFVIAFILGIFIKKLFKWLDKNWPHHRRIPIFSLVICFIFAYSAEKFFNIADITGAYIAGLIISSTSTTSYIDNHTESASQIFFSPIFFVSIALKLYDMKLDSLNARFIIFGILFIIIGLLTKFVGAYIGARFTKFDIRQSAALGVGMMARAEVVIVSTQKGIETGLIPSSQPIMPFILILIILSSIITPILLKNILSNK
ncbi:MAG: cation:proton antiporter [Bacillales bacterium]